MIFSVLFLKLVDFQFLRIQFPDRPKFILGRRKQEEGGQEETPCLAILETGDKQPIQIRVCLPGDQSDSRDFTRNWYCTMKSDHEMSTVVYVTVCLWGEAMQSC
jgi:hypothetical protein